MKIAAAAGVSVSADVAGASVKLLELAPTPPEVKGPFYPILARKDEDFDLTRIAGNADVAKGEIIVIEGRVVDTESQAVPDAIVELWQAGASGKYNHPYDPNPAPADPNFQGWAVVPSGTRGTFTFKTVMPGSYPVSANWMRPPHIHFKVSKRGYIELITQMYFPDHPLNAEDRLLLRKNEAQRKLMIARAAEDGTTFRYRVVLEKA